MLELTDDALLTRLKNCEDTFVERKTVGDSKDWLKTVVAFANSTPFGFPAVLFIGARDDGTIEDRDTNFDTLQKTFNKAIGDYAYPTIYYLTRLLDEGGKQCLAVIVPGSANRPHFAGRAYVRVGSVTKDASEPQFDSLIAERQSKAYEILRWQGQEVSVEFIEADAEYGRIRSLQVFMVIACNAFYTTLQQAAGKQICVPLPRIRISFDTDSNRLKLEVEPL